MSKNVARLYQQFVPENYKLEININPENMTFKGTVEITGKKIGRPSKRITFHQKGLKITSAKITKKDKTSEREIVISRINKHSALQEVRLHSESLIYPGNYRVIINFEAPIDDNMNGLYPCYFEHDGKTKRLFATQFESHHAREVFPCIDEPSAKATFDLSITAPKGPTFLSNTPEKESVDLEGSLTKVTFETSPIMSTYLLAFVYGEIQSVESKTKKNVLVRIWATVAQPKENLNFALKEAVAIQDFFEDYFKTPFPLKKCDHIALPDFDAGAMENWGLITYRESALLTDPANRSIPSEQYVANVISHELSHQWFGNLVTMAWWDDLWLNESFASIMEHIPLDYLHPDWKQWETYTSYDVISASNRDIFSDVQNVGVGVNHPDEIRSLFDGAIVYSKGGRLIKMLREYVGDETLRTSLQNYFKKHAYKNATREDLWEAISEASGNEVARLMTPWIEQSGMPLITVRTGDDEDSRNIKQSRFILDKKNDDSLWPIPLLACTEVSPDLIESSEATIKLKEPDSPLILNRDGSGHFIVRYSDKNDQKKLINSMKKRSISSETRINVLNDYLLLARRGDISLAEVLELVSAMEDEPRDSVWDMVARALGFASAIGENNKTIETGLEKLRYKLANKNYKKLGWEDKPEDDPNTASLRSSMIGLMISSKDQEMISFVLNYYKSIKIEDIPADRRAQVLSTVVKYGKEIGEANKLINLYKESQTPDLLQSISAGLCSTESPDLARRLLEEGLNENGFVKPQDYFRWFAYLSRNKYTREETWTWLVKEWDRLLVKFSGGINVDYFISFPSGPIYTKDKQERFNEFFGPKTDIVRVSRAIKVAQAEISARVAWRDRDLAKIESFFKAPQ